MYTGLKHLHSFLPYIILPLLLIAVVVFWLGYSRKAKVNASTRRLALITMILTHVQLLLGLVLYFISPLVKAAFESSEMMANATHRLYAVEHLVTMLLAIGFITVGYSRSKRQQGAKAFKTLGLFYLIGLVLMLARIPWETWLPIG